MNPQVTTGYLGWSNIRSGLEFYVGGQGNARWTPRRGEHARDGEKGTLLQDDLERDGYYEGTSVVVIALPGRLPEKLATFLAAQIALHLEEHLGKAEEMAMAVDE